MKIFTDSLIFQKEMLTLKKNKTIGFVPTMGALHEGHISLIERAKKENDFCVVSIYVNPTQFNDPKDFEKYPLTYEQDCEILRKHNVDYLFSPTYSQIYPDGFNFEVSEKNLSSLLCGKFRPGHFVGVLTVVLKLLNLAQATKAYFGEKDYQQFKLIEKMAQAFFIPTEIISSPTIRDKDGLALSSRNQLLSTEGIDRAKYFAQTLKRASDKNEIIEKLNLKEIEIDYIEEFENRRYSAVRIDNVRLIDNVPI